MVIQGVLPLSVLYVIKLVIDTIATGVSSQNHDGVIGRAFLLICLAGAAALISSLCRSLGVLVSEAQGRLVTDHVNELIHAKSVELDLEYFENSKYHDALHRAQQEAAFRPTRIVKSIAQIGVSGVALGGITALLFSLHSWIAVVVVLAALPGVLMRFAFAGTEHEWRRKRTLKDRMSSYIHCILTWELYAKEVRVFGLGRLFRERFSELRSQTRDEDLRFSIKRSGIDALTQLTAIVAIFGCFAFVAGEAITGKVTLGALVLCYQALQRGQEYVAQMLSGLAGLYEDNLFVSDLLEFLDLKPRVADPERPLKMPRPLQSGIVFDGVSFCYPNGSSNVLEDISLTVRPGEVVALIGENGSGKTTLIKLLSRLYDPTRGAIKIDGIDLRELSLDDLRQNISVIFQDYAHYHLSARENIWLGNIALRPDAEDVVTLSRKTGADSAIRRLPHGYDTLLGKLFAGGEELSIGQWQRVALTRALLREAQIMVLDEPTSAMDANAEYEIFSRFQELASGRTSIIISHRLSTVRMANYIYVLEEGRITEGGTHDELLHLGGKYASLFETQASALSVWPSPR